MANKTIPQLPEQTGKTDNDLLAIVDSGETTTSKIKVSTLLAGIGGDLVGTANDTLTNKNGLGPADNTISGTTDFVNFGWNNYVSDSSVNFGYDNRQQTGIGTGGVSFGRGNINGRNNFVYLGIDNDGVCCGGDGVNVGINNKNSRGTHIGKNNQLTTATNNGSGVAVGVSNTPTTNFYNLFGSLNVGKGFVYGSSNNTNDNNIVLGRTNTLSVGNGSLGYNMTLGYNNVISAGYGQTIMSNDSDITSTGNYNNIIGGFQSAITGTTSGTTIVGLNNFTATADDTIYYKHSKNVGQSVNTFYNNLSGDTFTIDWNEGNLQKIYMTGDTSLTFSNVKDGATYKLQVENGGTHSITGVTASGFTILCEGGSIPNITNNGVDLCVLEVMDTDILVRHFANFATP